MFDSRKVMVAKKRLSAQATKHAAHYRKMLAVTSIVNAIDFSVWNSSDWLIGNERQNGIGTWISIEIVNVLVEKRRATSDDGVFQPVIRCDCEIGNDLYCHSHPL